MTGESDPQPKVSPTVTSVPQKFMQPRAGTGVQLIATAVLIATGLFLFHAAWYESSWYFSIGFLLAALALMVAGQAAIRIWNFSIAPLFHDRRAVLVRLTVLPFWYFGGAIGYTVGMLVAKKLGILNFWDQPVSRIFHDGGLLGCLVNGVHEVLASGVVQKLFSKSES